MHPVPPTLPAPGRSGKWVFWSTFVASALLACFLFVPMARATAVLFPLASTRVPTWWFPQRINNAILLWAVANGLIGLLAFRLTYVLHGKRNGVTPEMWGLATTGRELAKTFGLALTVFAGFYVLLFVSYGLFHTDFRFLFVSAAASFPEQDGPRRARVRPGLLRLLPRELDPREFRRAASRGSGNGGTCSSTAWAIPWA